MSPTSSSLDQPAAIAHEIDVTRSEVDQTLDALQAKLSPGQLLDRAVEFMRENGGELASNLGRSVKQNPLPVILTGVGLLWMMSTSRASAHPTGRLSGDGLAETGHRAARATSDAMRDARGRMADVTESASNTASSVAGKVSSGIASAADRGRHLSASFSELMHEQPVIVGAVALALGVLLGYALPSTEAEDRLFGDVSDETVRQAKEATAPLAENGPF